MGVYSSETQRPPNFELNPYSPLATGLVFAGLGRITGSTHYRDSSPYGRHGTLTAMDGSNWAFDSTLGRFKLNFPSGTGYVVIPTTVLPVSTWTLSAWAKCSVPTEFMNLFGDYTQPWIFYIRDGERALVMFPTWGDVSWTVDTSFTAKIRHFSARAVATGVELFIDGVSHGTKTITHATAPSITTVGPKESLYGVRPQGPLVDSMIHSRSLSTAEIQALADPSNVMLSGLVLPPRRRLWAVSGGAAPTTTRRRRIICGA